MTPALNPRSLSIVALLAALLLLPVYAGSAATSSC